MNDGNKISEHTIKKFDLVAGYVASWIHKLMNNSYCKEVVFIDCMCNNGIYKNCGNTVEGTPIRVAKIISEAMKNYSNKKANLYFNDKDQRKILELKGNLPEDTNNFKIHLSVDDGNDLLKNLKDKLLRRNDLHYLLFYDPYMAKINWEAIAPYFFGWGEVILNHMESDTRRAIKSVKRQSAIDKYEKTYLTSIKELVSLHGDKNAYNKLIENIIKELGKISKREYYLAVVPFFIKTNAKIYNIVYFTKNKDGFILFKKTAWRIFGGKSSNQNTHGAEMQQSLFETTDKDKDCYYVIDIVNYIITKFKGRNISLQEIWNLLDEHPVFPTDGYKKEIKAELKRIGYCKIIGNNIQFN